MPVSLYKTIQSPGDRDLDSDGLRFISGSGKCLYPALYSSPVNTAYLIRKDTTGWLITFSNYQRNIIIKRIGRSLDAIKKDRTVIIISHSISQIIAAENVIVLDKGRVMEQGSYEQLYEKKGRYFEIFNALANSLNIDKITETINE